MSSQSSHLNVASERLSLHTFATGPVSALYRRFVEPNPYSLWLANLALLAILVVWVSIDPAFEAAVAHGTLIVRAFKEEVKFPTLQHIGWRVTLLDIIAYAALLNFGLLAVGAAVGSTAHRRLRNLSGAVTLVGLWVLFAFGHPGLAWWAKAGRLQPDVSRFEAIAAELRNQWPAHDGELPQIGAFMAYPVGHPETLVLLTPPEVSSWGTAISAVEHSPRGALRFQLAGVEERDWVEWHPPGSEPTSFVGGLLDVWQVQESMELGHGWHLVRYALRA